MLLGRSIRRVTAYLAAVMLLVSCGSDPGDGAAGDTTPSASDTASVTAGESATASSTTSTPTAAEGPTSAQPIQPVINFGDRQTTFTRPFAFPLDATSTPPVPLAYQVVRGHPDAFNDDFCVVADGVLSFEENPPLTAACMVEVSATSLPAGYLDPDPVLGLVTVGFASWVVDAPSLADVRWSELPAGVLVITVTENSGDAFGITVEPDFDNGGADGCTYVSTDPSEPSPPGTTSYEVTLQLADPAGGSYTCALLAVGEPLDYSGGQGLDRFTVTVTP